MNDLVPSAKVTGKIMYKDSDIYSSKTDMVELRKEIGMVFQQPNPFPFSIYENVIYGLRLKGVKDKAILDEAVEESLKAANIWDEVKDKLHSSALGLSGGQQQRVAIARALSMDPIAMLFDEPTSALDPEMINEVLDVMVELAHEGMTMMCVTHEMGFARQVANRVLFMDQGKIVEDCSKDDFFNTKRGDRAQQFLDKILH